MARALQVSTIMFAAVSCLPSVSIEQASAQTGTEERADNMLGDIVVTARKRAENAQDIPISLTVASGEDLVAKSITQFIQLQQITPSLHIIPASFGNTSVILASRGVAYVDIRLNNDPAVGIYVDGVYLPRAVGVNASELLDIARVEVLSGPQGTLFGKNTSGGAINFFTQAPTDRLEGSVKARIGAYGDRAASAVLNLPVTDTLSSRSVASFFGRDGYGRNMFDGSRTDKVNGRMFRTALSWTPGTTFQATLRADYSRTRSTQGAYKGFSFLQAPTVAGAGTGGPFPTVEAALERNDIPNLAAWLALSPATRDALLLDADRALRTFSAGNARDGNFDQAAREDMKAWGFSATIDYDLNDKISAKSITALRRFDRNGTSDLDGTPYAILQYPYLAAHDRQFSQELQISGDFLDGRLKSILGLYYSKENGMETSWQESLRRIGGNNAITFQNARVGNRSKGIFTQHTFRVLDTLSVTGGVRLSRDDRSLDSSNYNNTNCLSLGRSLASIGGIANCIRPMDVSFTRWSYTGSIEYKPDRDLLFYATTRRSYRSGGLQETAGATTVAAADVAFIPFRPEVVTDYEVGMKSEWFDRRLRVNVSGYHSIIDDSIRNQARPVVGSTSTPISTQNAAGVKVNGIEFEATVLPVKGLEISTNGAYTDAKFTRYLTPTGVDLTNLPVWFTPKWRIGVSAAYTQPITIGTVSANIDYSWEDRQLVSEPSAYSPSHEQLNARIALDLSKSGTTFAIFAKNITKEKYGPGPIDLSGALGFVASGQYNPPRTYGAEITKTF
ncbi:TonB-dependent receptor (plasmid) [Sphingobium sp. SJ10-10]|uniref:TonB-dependent receptor n=1 Tax=unclassified Sphingobium TaxID=2611147 RepID=UPI000770525E|nr:MULTISPECIES: TonB-dependent receptor [unclassified Sphingobium]AMK26547.1 TonB-dependent receptor [Sphingobium sp. TKS]MEC6699571.1 TonB-dependent receptor [Sphingobium sp. SJ10-10]